MTTSDLKHIIQRNVPIIIYIPLKNSLLPCWRFEVIIDIVGREREIESLENGYASDRPEEKHLQRRDSFRSRI